jgi:hypothetical protein
VVCESALAFFNDSILPPHAYAGPKSGYLSWILARHNEQVEPDRQIRMGTCWWLVGEKPPEDGSPVAEPDYDVDDYARRVINGEFGSGMRRRRALEALDVSYERVQNRVNEILGSSFRFDLSNLDTQAAAYAATGTRDERITAGREDYANTINVLLEDWCSIAGGFLLTRSVTEDGSVVTYLDTLASQGTMCGQEIRYGRNLLEFEENLDADGLYTRLVPLGPKQSGGQPLTIASVNSGKIYLEDSTLAGIYGKITATETFSDCKTAAALKTAGQQRLGEMLGEALSLTVDAVDLRRLGAEPGAFFPGAWVRVVSPGHGYDEYLECVKIQRDWQRPDRDKYTFGVTRSGLSDAVTTALRAVGRTSGTVGTVEVTVAGVVTDLGDLTQRVEALEERNTAGSGGA